VFELTPGDDGSWTEKVLHSFNGVDGHAPEIGLVFDVAGNLYGTTSEGGALDYGTVFELMPRSDGKWEERLLHSFLNRRGSDPSGLLIFDSAHNIYGTTEGDEQQTFGSVVEIKP
jgi:uncharacterized repeat protein (TIGR03803 family)